LSNDDSLLCLNFFSYIITKSIFIGKFKFLQKFKNNVVFGKNNLFNKKLIFYSNVKIKNKLNSKKNKLKDKANFNNRFKFFMDDVINENIEKFNLANEIKYKLTEEFEVFFSFTLPKDRQDNFNLSYSIFNI
jgi:hypothetical protein